MSIVDSMIGMKELRFPGASLSSTAPSNSSMKLVQSRWASVETFRGSRSAGIKFDEPGERFNVV